MTKKQKRSKPQRVTTETLPENQQESTQISPMDKNTHNDKNYQRQVLLSLAKMDGISIEEAEEKLGPAPMVQMSEQGSAENEEFEAQKQRILESSEARSKMLAERISSKSGGNLTGHA
jgi:hypothetical protein